MKKAYVVTQGLNISMPLTDIEEKGDYLGIHKLLTTNNGNFDVLYMVDGMNFGPGSVIEVEITDFFPIVYKKDCKVIEHKEYTVNKELIKKLIKKK